MTSTLASPKWFLVLGGYVLLCIPAIFVVEQLQWPQWPLHTTQFAASVLCFLSAAAFLWSTRGEKTNDLRPLAGLAVALTGVWLGFVGLVMLTFDLSGVG